MPENKALQWRHNEPDGVYDGFTNVYSSVCSGPDQRKHQSSASLAFVRGIHGWPVNSPRKGPVTPKKFPFDDVIMKEIYKRNKTPYKNYVHAMIARL